MSLKSIVDELILFPFSHCKLDASLELISVLEFSESHNEEMLDIDEHRSRESCSLLGSTMFTISFLHCRLNTSPVFLSNIEFSESDDGEMLNIDAHR